jgi:pyruvate dehydrogenase E2 component (dihydrolipoyllysine-residue acetyltransferase)
MRTEVRIPELSESSEEATLVRWLKGEGEAVAAGEAIAEIETDKATVELESPNAGTLEKATVAEGASVKVGDVVALVNDQIAPRPRLLAVKGEEPTAESRSGPAAAQVERAPVNSRSGPGEPIQIEEHKARTAAATPLARRMAALANLDLDLIPTRSPDRKVRKIDVESALGITPEAASVAPEKNLRVSARPATVPATERKELSRTRKIIAQRMTESKRAVPHFYLSIDCRLDELLELRKLANQSSGQPAASITAFFVRAAALALRKAPEVNAAWADDAILVHDRVDIAVAVASERGLVTPVIREADRKNVLDIAGELRELTARTHAGKLAPGEYENGTFTLSNLGMHSVHSLYAIINPPQSCILGTGAAEERPIARDGQVMVATMFTATLSADHRVLDGTAGAAFLSAFKDFVQNPIKLLL